MISQPICDPTGIKGIVNLDVYTTTCHSYIVIATEQLGGKKAYDDQLEEQHSMLGHISIIVMKRQSFMSFLITYDYLASVTITCHTIIINIYIPSKNHGNYLIIAYFSHFALNFCFLQSLNRDAAASIPLGVSGMLYLIPPNRTV